MVKCCVFFAVRTEFWNNIYTRFGFKGLKGRNKWNSYSAVQVMVRNTVVGLNGLRAMGRLTLFRLFVSCRSTKMSDYRLRFVYTLYCSRKRNADPVSSLSLPAVALQWQPLFSPSKFFIHSYIFISFATKICQTVPLRFAVYICHSVCPLLTSSLKEFSWNMMMGSFTKHCQHIQTFVKVEQQ
jgi:hypothetical protein